MFRNYLAAALGHLARNPLYTAINIAGLAVGLAAALLISLYVRKEASYDRWLPNHESVVRISGISRFGANAADVIDAAPHPAAPLLRQEFPAVRAAVRLIGGPIMLRHQETEAEEQF